MFADGIIKRIAERSTKATQEDSPVGERSIKILYQWLIEETSARKFLE